MCTVTIKTASYNAMLRNDQWLTMHFKYFYLGFKDKKSIIHISKFIEILVFQSMLLVNVILLPKKRKKNMGYHASFQKHSHHTDHNVVLIFYIFNLTILFLALYLIWCTIFYYRVPACTILPAFLLTSYYYLLIIKISAFSYNSSSPHFNYAFKTWIWTSPECNIHI